MQYVKSAMDHAKGFRSLQNTQTSWLIVIFATDRWNVLSRGIYEVVHLADNFTSDRENRAHVVQHVYMSLADEVERQCPA